MNALPTILIVDDHSDMRHLMRVTVGNDFNVLEVEDGRSGLDVARRMNPDIIVLDVMMPGEMDGLQVLDAIKSNPRLKQTPVIMVTARGQAEDYEDGVQRGAAAYIIKPFSPVQLVGTIRTALAR